MEPQELNLDIPDSGAVFAFGKGVPARFHIKSDSVISAACGEGHALVATTSGRLFAFGQNDYGQLGLGHKDPGSAKPVCVRRLKELGRKAVRVACGPTHSLVTTEGGAVYGFGNNADGQLAGPESDHALPVEIGHLSGKEVKDLAAGRSFSLALTKQGEIYSWGSNAEGCLGSGGPEPDELRDRPALVQLPDRVLCMSAGSYHCACVLADGRVFAWGESEGGKLGIPGSEEKDIHYAPQQVPLPDGVAKARAVSCGLQHTLVLTDTGRALACGTGDSGQLGLGAGRGYAPELQPIAALEDVEVMGISAGERHSVCVTAKAGHLFTFGDALHGKLGPSSRLGGQSNQHRPFRVAALNPLRVRRAVCGTLITLVLTVPRAAGEPVGDPAEELLADDPLDAMAAKSPRPLRSSDGADNEVGSGGQLLLRRRSTRSRERFRESARASQLLPEGGADPAAGIQLVRPPAAPGAVPQQTLEKPTKLKQLPNATEKSSAIDKFDELLGKPKVDSEDDRMTKEAPKPVEVKKVKRKLERSPSQAQPFNDAKHLEDPPPVQAADPDPRPDAQADRPPEEAPVLIEQATVQHAEAPAPKPPPEPPLKASASEVKEAEVAAPVPSAAEEPEASKASDPVKSAGCGRRSKVTTMTTEQQPTTATPEELPKTDSASSEPVKGVGCGRGRRKQPPPPEEAPGVTEETVAPAEAAKVDSAPPPPPSPQDQPEKPEPDGTSEPVKSVGCGRGRRKQPPQVPSEEAPGVKEEAVAPADAVKVESTPPPPPAEQPLEEPSKTESDGASGDPVKNVGCGRGRRKEPPPSSQAPTDKEAKPDEAASATEEATKAEQPSTGAEPPADAKKSRSCSVL